MRNVDDVLDVFHTHFVAAIVGGVGTGIFATAEGATAFVAPYTTGGAVSGYGRQVGLQIVGALFIIGWNIVWTSLIMAFIKYVLRVKLRMTEEAMLIGDYAIHGEEPYIFSEGHRTHSSAERGANAGDHVIMGTEPNNRAASTETDEIKKD